MLATKEDIQGLILAAAAKVWADGGHGTPPDSGSNDLFGGDSPLDSMDLVSLVVELEEQIHAKFGREITLADERAMSQATNPFRNVESLADYAYGLLAEA
jgi:acyl carrier protein